MRECLDDGTLQSYCDGELSGAHADGITTHLTQCSSCSAQLDELMSANDIVFAALSPEFQAVVPTERLRQRIDDAIAVGPVFNTAKSSTLARAGGWFAALGGLFTLRPQAFGYASLVAVLAFASVFGLAYWKSTSTQELTPVALVDSEAKAPAPAPRAVNPDYTEVNPKPTPVPLGYNPPKSARPSSNSASSVNKTVARVKLLPGERSYLKTIAALDSTIKSSSDRPMRPELQAEYERNLALVDRALAAARSAAKSNPDDPDAAEFVFAAYQTKVDLLNTVADARVYNRQP